MPARTAVLATLLAAAPLAAAGPLTPPAGPVSPTHKTLSQVEPRTPISSLPFSITQPGSYYLTADLTGVPGFNGITVAASDVTVDLCGYTLRGVAGSLSGIAQAQANGLRHITVKNGVVRDWANFGVILSEYSRVENITTRNNQSTGVHAGAGSIITGCIANFNDGHGISVAGDGVISACTALLNAVDGFNAGGGSVLTACTARQSGRDGFGALGGVTVEHCSSTSNQGDAFDLGRESAVRASAASSSLGAGFRVTVGSTVESCRATNCEFGVAADRLCRIQSNHCADGATGIHLTGADNVLDSNTVIGNTFGGIDIDAAGNLVVRNATRGNGSNFLVVAGNTVGVIIAAPTSSAISGSTGGAGVGTSNPFANLSF